ncbi:MAG: dynamin family protein [Pseudomonadota bacterium]
MNIEAPKNRTDRAENTVPYALLRSSYAGLRAYAEGLGPLRQALQSLRDLGDAPTQKMAQRLESKLDAMEPSVTMIGQIKSGKTSLVNAMIGWPDLLPADVNPWTSVVTSLHVSPTPLTPETSAKFCFFEPNEWERLTAGGGRIGELADRAGADEELSKIKRQVEEMREKSQARLGRKFEALLGQHHDYGYFDPELIERYVCLGDAHEPEGNKGQGRFADVTRSADLYFHQPVVPMRLCLRDTPGVNDTFMMREQITIRAIRDSRLCVVVLSAHQALSSTDLALVRLIAHVKSRDVIIFVNRIDELSDPGTQVPQIHKSILDTLEAHNGPKDAEIIFGSALWALNAMSGPLSALPEASKAALINWAKACKDPQIKNKKARSILWYLSGLPGLNTAIADRIAKGVGREIVDQISATARNLLNNVQVADNLTAKAEIGEAQVHITADGIKAALNDVTTHNIGVLRKDLEKIYDDFGARLERVHLSFLGRATEALIAHLERFGEQTVWEYDPSGLRMLLSSSYRSFGKRTQAAYAERVEAIVAEIAALYQEALQLPEALFDIKAPPMPPVPPPVSLGQTIALDLRGGWWKSWWFRRRGYQAFAADFHAMVREETISFLDDLKTNQADVLHAQVLTQVDGFLREQSEMLLCTLARSSLNDEALDELFDRKTLAARDSELKQAHVYLDEVAP